MAGPLKGYQWTTASSYEYITGNYEDPQVLETFCSWLQPTTVLYDIGANVGFFSLLSNRFITAGKIYAFEPLPSNLEVFEEHMARNKKYIVTDNITILPLAVSDKEKEVDFSNNVKNRDGNTYIKGSITFTEAESTIRVRSYSIDELIQKGYAVPDVLKIDVEGAEYDVLAGAVNTLKEYKPLILLATHDCHLPGVKVKCLNFLEGLGYVLKHKGDYNKQLPGLDDFFAIHREKV